MIVITGATGTIGREVASLLLVGGHNVTAISRNPTGARFSPGISVVGGNPSEPKTLDGAWDGAEAVLLSPRASRVSVMTAGGLPGGLVRATDMRIEGGGPCQGGVPQAVARCAGAAIAPRSVWKAII